MLPIFIINMQKYKPRHKATTKSRPNENISPNEIHQLTKLFSDEELTIVKQLALKEIDYNSSPVSDDIQDKLYDFFHNKMPSNIIQNAFQSPGNWIVNRLNNLYRNTLP